LPENAVALLQTAKVLLDKCSEHGFTPWDLVSEIATADVSDDDPERKALRRVVMRELGIGCTPSKNGGEPVLSIRCDLPEGFLRRMGLPEWPDDDDE
jgi:hypothetical protein